MRHTARAHFNEVVVPTFCTFAEHYAQPPVGHRVDTRNAATCAGALLDVADHLHSDERVADGQIRERFSNPRSLRESFWAKHEQFEIICDFANAWKHRRITREGRKLSSLDNTLEGIVVTRCTDDRGHYYFIRKYLALQLDDGRELEVFHLLGSSLYMWGEYLASIGAISPPRLQVPRPNEFLTRSQAESHQLPLFTFTAGEYVEFTIRTFVYRPELQQATPATDEDGFSYHLNFQNHVAPRNPASQ